MEKLKLNSNSFYVLKSRLYDKVQEHLSGDIHANREEVTRQLHKIPEMCYSVPREVATAFLLKLEKDLVFHDMHNELLVVYSALKQLHLFSEKYFHYSQLYNKHIAFSLSVEKSSEILGNFNRILGQYHFSRSPRHLETLSFLRKGVNDHYTLQPSRQIGIIRNMIDIQLLLFCGVPHAEFSGADLLAQTTTLIAELPDSSQLKIWTNCLDFLYFEFYHSTGQRKRSIEYFNKINSRIRSLLLYSNICVTSFFLSSRITYLQAENRVNELAVLTDETVFYDSGDLHTKVMLVIHNAMADYYAGRIKEATISLNQLLSDHSFKDLTFAITEIKLTLSYFYILSKEYEVAAHLLRNLQRRIKSEESPTLSRALYLVKVLNSVIKEPASPPGKKQLELLNLFFAYNKNETRMLPYLEHEIKKNLKQPLVKI
jgi:hypothetical protein